jgi:transcriptional regulator with XRE-family HTH domain
VSPDDPRHGTSGGWPAHRRAGQQACQPCKDANALYQRRYRKRRMMYGDRTVNPAGTIRRLQALMAVGWSMASVAERIGMESRQVWWTTRQKYVRVSTAARIAEVYDELADARPPTDTTAQRISVAKTLAHATRQGFAPPIAWDDNIDDPDAEPYAAAEEDIDEVVVERLMAGVRMRSTKAEKFEAMRRWMSSGRSQRSLCTIHGWYEGRYVDRAWNLALVDGRPWVCTEEQQRQLDAAIRQDGAA